MGEEKALWIYQQLLDRTDAVLQQCSGDVHIFYAGGAATEFGNCFQRFPKTKQQGSDLGERMEAAFRWGFTQGYPKIVGIGTDLWGINQSLLEGALSALDGTEVVFGPATDGGYYLLGMKTLQEALFRDKVWSSDRVLRDSLNDLVSKRIALLEEKSDLDSVDDLLLYPDLVSRLHAHFNPTPKK